jgi:hypothetical protein
MRRKVSICNLAVVKKTLPVTVFIWVFLFSAVALFQFVSLASANPYEGTPVPPSFQTPNKDQPIVTIQSPYNTTYYENKVSLNFTVTQPDSWFEANVSCWIKSISYQLDGQTVTLYEPTPSLYELPATKQFSIDLRELTAGQHTLQVNVSAESIYCPHPTYLFFLVEHYSLDVSQKIHFMVLDLRIVGFAIGATVVAIAGIIGIAVYRRKKSAKEKIGEN